MYTYVSAFAKRKKSGSRWKSENLKDITLEAIFAKYKQIYLILSNNFMTTNVGFDLENIRASHYHSKLTVAQFLIANDNKALLHMPSIPKIDTKQVKYADGFHAGYKIEPVPKTAAMDSPIPNSERPYLLLTRPDTDYELFYKNCLITVNGYFHLTDYDTKGIYVVDGNKTARHSNNNLLGIHSFREVGEVEQIPITLSMIHNQVPEIPLTEKCYIKLGKDIGNKVPAIVIGGYLHLFDDNTYRMVDESTMCVDFINYRLMDRYYESKKHIDLSSLPIEKYDRNDEQVAVVDLFSEDVIKAYLTLPQSFVILIDCSDLFVEKVAVEQTKMPGMLVSSIKPNMTLIGGYGKVLDYLYNYEDRKYSVICHDDSVDMRMYNTTEPGDLLSITDHRIPTDRMRKSHSYFLKIGKDISL